jgi:SAM-dependent methyltransferase
MTPVPAPAELPESKWSTWQTLQQNGLVSYTAAPEFNLSVGVRQDAQAFKDFCRMSGLILDVGCGPQTRASYQPAAGESGEVAGIDPLIGQQPREFAFVQGIGEYLPFRSATFDHVLYATSLDHVVDPKRSLAEATRCLKPGGSINLWLDAQATEYVETDATELGHYRLLVRKGFRSLMRHRWLNKLGLRRTLSYMTAVARMDVPEGAIDCFHFEHLTSTAVSAWLSELNVITVRQEQFEDNHFIQATR